MGERILALPETEQVEWWWIEGRSEHVTKEQARVQFDAWLAKVKAEAWENGLNTGIGYAAVMHLVVSEPQNPYASDND